MSDWPSFSKGEIAPDLYARFDTGPYAVGLKKARNCIVMKYGGVTKRPGLRFVANVLDNRADARLVPFQLSLTLGYAMELGQGSMRLAALGGLVLETELAITSISKSAQALVGAANHGYAVGDDVYFQGVTGMIEINDRVGRVVDVINSHTFQVDIDTRGFGTFTGASGGITRPDPPPAPPPVVPPDPPPPEPEPPPTTGGGWWWDGTGNIP